MSKIKIIQGLLHQLFIALDQLGNVFCWSSYDGRFGYADEAISARAWRLRRKSSAWALARWVIDAIFFWTPNHCKGAYERECSRSQMPPSYRSK